jgi:hypothetical protein
VVEGHTESMVEARGIGSIIITLVLLEAAFYGAPTGSVNFAQFGSRKGFPNGAKEPCSKLADPTGMPCAKYQMMSCLSRGSGQDVR